MKMSDGFNFKSSTNAYALSVPALHLPVPGFSTILKSKNAYKPQKCGIFCVKF